VLPLIENVSVCNSALESFISMLLLTNMLCMKQLAPGTSEFGLPLNKRAKEVF
jgi:hypothetical protein